MIEETDPGWFKQKWRPVYGGTYCFWRPHQGITGFAHKYAAFGIKLQQWREGGWGRSYKVALFQFSFFSTWEFWIKWDFSRMKELQ
jgi:hypothetical protein